MSRLNAPGAVTELRAAARLDPDRPEVRNMLGLALAATGRNAEAMEQFALALRARPGYASARYNLATALARAGRVDEAVDNLRQVLAANPEDAAAKRRLSETLTLRGMLLLRDGKRDLAVAQFEEALQLDPSNEDAHQGREQALAH